MNNVKSRKTSVELLRIIAMLFIITSHYSVHGGFNYNSMSFGFNKVLLNVSILGNLGVNIFFIISGYYLSKSEFKLKKILLLIFQTLTYSIFIFVLLSFFDSRIFTKQNMISSFIPITLYWFMSAYTILYLFFPYLNKIIVSIDKNDFKRLLCIMIILWSILPTFFKIELFPSTLIDVLILYFAGAYLRYYVDFDKFNQKHLIGVLCLFLLIMLILTIVVNMHNYLLGDILVYYNKNSPFTIIIAILLFIIFYKLEFENNIINYISSCVLGIYLFHDNDFIRYRLWQSICKNYLYQHSDFLILHLLICVIGVFIIGLLIEMLRKKSVGKLTELLADKLSNKYETLKKNNHNSK